MRMFARISLAIATTVAATIPMLAIDISTNTAEAKVVTRSTVNVTHMPVIRRSCRAISFDTTSTNGAVLRDTLIICNNNVFCEITQIRYANSRTWVTLKNTCMQPRTNRLTRPFAPSTSH